MQERLGHVTKAQKAGVAAVQMVGEVKPPPLPKGTHPTARRWYRSLQESGQAYYFEPSDWAAALYVAEAMTRNLEERFSAQLFGTVWAAMEDLMTTEAARRRARVEVERLLSAAPEDDAPTALDDYRKMVGA